MHQLRLDKSAPPSTSTHTHTTHTTHNTDHTLTQPETVLVHPGPTYKSNWGNLGPQYANLEVVVLIMRTPPTVIVGVTETRSKQVIPTISSLGL